MRFLHQYILQMPEWCVMTRFHCGPDPIKGSTYVQKRMRAPKGGAIRRNRPTYSCITLIDCPFCKRPMREYVVSNPLIMMKGSVYKDAALAITVHGCPIVSAMAVRFAYGLNKSAIDLCEIIKRYALTALIP